MRSKKIIYLDHAAATPLAPEVFLAMKPYLTSEFGNPSALYQSGLRANSVLTNSRRSIAEVLHTQPDTIIFTSGGTEANNLAVFGVVEGKPRQPAHFISTPIDHHSVLRPLQELERRGNKVTYLKVDRQGFVNPPEVIRAIRPESVLISIIYANNEIGTIEPIAEVGRLLLKYRKEHHTPYPYFHTDACQAAGYLNLEVEKLHVDLMTINGSKIYGPKGVGMLYARRGVKIAPLIFGGSQERGWRAGTENVPGIAGLSVALVLAEKNKAKEVKRLKKLTDFFYRKLIARKIIAANALTGPELGENRLPNNLNITIPGVDGETLLLYLDAAGVACSTASACVAEEGEASHVLETLGLTAAEAKSSLRFSLGRGTEKSDVEFAVEAIAKCVKLLKK